MDKQHKHCPVCGDVMEEVPGNDTFQIFFCRKYPCRAISVSFTTNSKVVVNKIIILNNEKDIDERGDK